MFAARRATIVSMLVVLLYIKLSRPRVLCIYSCVSLYRYVQEMAMRDCVERSFSPADHSILAARERRPQEPIEALSRARARASLNEWTLIVSIINEEESPGWETRERARDERGTLIDAPVIYDYRPPALDRAPLPAHMSFDFAISLATMYAHVADSQTLVIVKYRSFLNARGGSAPRMKLDRSVSGGWPNYFHNPIRLRK